MTTTDRSATPIVSVAVAAAIASALPGFLVGALAVQVRSDFDVSESVYGWAISSYFLAGTAGSVVLGRLAQRIGARRQMGCALALATAANLAIAAGARSFGTMVGLMAAAGLCNSAGQTAVNLALTSAGLPRLGLAIAIKQSGMPAASMLSGLAVPAIALTLGWRWAFVAAACATATAAVAVLLVVDPHPVATATRHRQHPERSSPTSALVGAALACAFLAFAAGTLNAWVVASGVDTGLGEGEAGLMLSAGAALGIAIRLWWGFRLDGLSLLPFRVGGYMALVGAVGIALLSIRSTPIHVVATIAAFGSGWIWPVFTNFGVIRANAGRAAAATGVSQTGVYVGVFVAPLATGALIEHAGYGPMWLVTAGAMAAGAVIAVRVAHHF